MTTLVVPFEHLFTIFLYDIVNEKGKVMILFFIGNALPVPLVCFNFVDGSLGLYNNL